MRWIWIALTAVWLAACGPELETGDEESLKAKSYALHATDAPSDPWKTSFVIHTTSNLSFATDIGGAFSGHHTERSVLWTPTGVAYQVLSVAFATDVPAAPGEQQAEAISGGWRVWTSIPVAGTTIEEFNLTGRWSAGVFVDSATSSNATLTFSLQ